LPWRLSKPSPGINLYREKESSMANLLTQEDVDFYHEHGYVVARGAITGEKLEKIRRETDRVTAEAGGVSEHNNVYDLEDSHSPTNPRVRRIKEPFKQSAIFDEVARDPHVLDIVAQLVGPDIRLYGGKMNMKSAGYGAPVEWHQDWAFYPHTNDDVLATGLLLDDCDLNNGPLMVIPGSQKGPTYDHHSEGAFCGAMDPADPVFEEIDFSKAVPLTGKAGDMTIHHVRIVHGSALNQSNRSRRLLLHEYAAGDAWPLVGMKGAFEEFFFDMMVRGEPTNVPRTVDVPVRLPYPPARKAGSIYENQKGISSKFFDTFEATQAAE